MSAANVATAEIARAIGLCRDGHEHLGAKLLLKQLPRCPDMQGQLELGPVLLSLGHLREGWRQLEHRWCVEPLVSMRADYGLPQWTGQALDDAAVLVRAEQGIGDVIQFARYLPMLKGRGARVYFQPLVGLDRIAARFPGVDHVVQPGEALPGLDYYVNLLSLPLAFDTTLANLPSETPYLAADPRFVAKWKDRLGPRLKPRIGLSWAGSPRHRNDARRSLSFGQLEPLLDVNGVQWVSLQKGAAAVQGNERSAQVDWFDAGKGSDELDDAVAILDQVDLLVCVDTSLAHIMGALGKPAWLLLPQPADYRWFIGRDDSPWYPQARLFRQSVAGDWAPVVARAAQALVAWRDRVGSVPGRVESVPRERLRAKEPEPIDVEDVAIARETRAGLLEFFACEPGVGRALERYGEWAQASLETFAALLPQGSFVLNVGAGAGFHAIQLSRGLGTGGQLVALEARTPHRILLARNLAMHRSPNCKVVSWSQEGGVEAGHGAAAATLDARGLERLNGLLVGTSVDVDGMLAGAVDTLWRCRPIVCCMSDRIDPVRRAAERLVDCGYRTWMREAPCVDIANFNRRDLGTDVSTISTLIAMPEEFSHPALPVGYSPWP